MEGTLVWQCDLSQCPILSCADNNVVIIGDLATLRRHCDKAVQVATEFLRLATFFCFLHALCAASLCGCFRFSRRVSWTPLPLSSCFFSVFSSFGLSLSGPLLGPGLASRPPPLSRRLAGVPRDMYDVWVSIFAKQGPCFFCVMSHPGSAGVLWPACPVAFLSASWGRLGRRRARASGVHDPAFGEGALVVLRPHDVDAIVDILRPGAGMPSMAFKPATPPRTAQHAHHPSWRLVRRAMPP